MPHLEKFVRGDQSQMIIGFFAELTDSVCQGYIHCMALSISLLTSAAIQADTTMALSSDDPIEIFRVSDNINMPSTYPNDCGPIIQIPTSPSSNRSPRSRRFNSSMDRTPRMTLDFELLTIKVLASSCRNKLQVIKLISDAWNSEDNVEFPSERMEIELLIEYAIQASEEVATMAEQLLSGPPAYNDNPDEQRQRQLEVHVLSAITHEYVVDLETKLGELEEKVEFPLPTRVTETLSRAKRVQKEALEVLNVAKKLRQEEVTQ